MRPVSEILGCQSFTYRYFKDNAECIAKLKESGLSTIELCGRHVDFDDESTFDKVIALHEDAGVEIVSVGCVRFGNDPAKEEKFFDFVKRAGARFMTVDFPPPGVPDSYDLIQNVLVKRLQRVDGVASVEVHGLEEAASHGEPRAIRQDHRQVQSAARTAARLRLRG